MYAKLTKRAAPGAMLGSKLKDASKSMGLDSVFESMDKLTVTDAEKRAKLEQEAAKNPPGSLKEILKMPDMLKVSFVSESQRKRLHSFAARKVDCCA